MIGKVTPGAVTIVLRRDAGIIVQGIDGLILAWLYPAVFDSALPVNLHSPSRLHTTRVLDEGQFD